MTWRVARSLLLLRDEFNRLFPKRSKSHDGTIGDAAHTSRASDHNPWVQDAGTGVVTALDITHDPAHGVDTHAIAEFLRKHEDPRIKYVISAGRIFSSTQHPFQWRKYTGSNPHHSHMHVSVIATKSKYDSVTPWKLPPGRLTDYPPPPSDEPADRPILHRGSKGEYVRTVQRLLALNVDGTFGSGTEAAVKGFQRGVDLDSDGVVGPLTWEELDRLEQVPVEKFWNHHIIATVFGGVGDPQKSAYEDRMIKPDEIGVALPARFHADERPPVYLANLVTGKTVVAQIVDVGPWNTDDPYWMHGQRPQAESGKDSRGRKTNGAGIDLTPGAAEAIGLNGKGKINWAFVSDLDLEG